MIKERWRRRRGGQIRLAVYSKQNQMWCVCTNLGSFSNRHLRLVNSVCWFNVCLYLCFPLTLPCRQTRRPRDENTELNSTAAAAFVNAPDCGLV